jgi:excisionase family DNA binding protein
VNDEWMSVKELADWLGVEPQVLYNLRYAHGEPRGVRVGRQLRFRKSDVELWLRSLSES